MFADVALPVPLDQAFTYRLPETLWHRVAEGSRLVVPFGSRKLTGVIVRVHEQPPEAEARDALNLLDELPVLDPALIELGRWIASYYCAPIGEVLKSMLPLAGEMRSGKVYCLTPRGREIARQYFLVSDEADAATQILRLLEPKELSASYITRKVPGAARILKSLESKGLVSAEDNVAQRDPLRASAERLRVEFVRRDESAKLKKSERELLSFLELHPGSHNLAETATIVKGASESARALARKELVSLVLESPLAYSSTSEIPKKLNDAQQAAFDALAASVRQQQFQTFLLHGVTGSGKTEVYMRAIEATLAMGRSALLLVPEIALTPQVAGHFYRRFGDQVAILHSAFHDAERAEQWRRVRSGAATVVVGTRSGVFAPVQKLGLIVVDEEHDGSYKQHETPRYHGRDVAIMRARAVGATVVLGSATPSLESRFNAQKGKYQLLELPDRVQQRPMPTVELVDMREEFLQTRKQQTFSGRLIEAITQKLEIGEQVMLLHNRRGYSSFVACRACGERLECVNCAVTLTFHRGDRRMLCHYCGFSRRPPSVCPKCNSEHIQFLGTGSEKVEDELHQHFPKARIARLDRDTVTGKRQFETILQSFREHRYDILVGTQMIAKGHDIPNVTLVGVVAADIGLGVPDFRAAERTFQLLTQVAGRAGRGDLSGHVLMQTLNPDHYAVRLAAAQDYHGFYARELQFRQSMRYPPFSALANVLIRHQKQEEALRMSAELGHLLTPPPEKIKVMGPAEAPVPRLLDEFRYQLLLKANSRTNLHETVSRLRSHALQNRWSPTSLVIDVDPISLL
ncbi:MAG TPA: primosomal protein N' [Bryobacteraceae bacterium]|nr:primosomal protein N' [Bryobacteraceae bacterium]